jgi:type I restriction enzyme R subunit
LDLNEDQKKIITGKIIGTIDELNTDFFLVREKQKTIKKIQENELNLDLHVKELMEDIAPLMITRQGQNSQVSSFILKTEQLYPCILERDMERVNNLKNQIQYMVENVLRKDNLHEVSRRKDILVKVLQMEFWEDLTFYDVDFMVREIAPLMKYFDPEPREIVDIGASDKIISWEEMEKEITEDIELKNFLERNPIANKIKKGECITSPELLELELELSSLKPEITIKNVQKYHNMDFIKFLWDIIGLTRKEDPKALIEDHFDQYILESSNYNSRQLDFLLLLKKVFSDRKQIDIGDLGKSPLGEEHPLELFSFEELEGIVNTCKQIRLC